MVMNEEEEFLQGHISVEKSGKWYMVRGFSQERGSEEEAGVSVGRKVHWAIQVGRGGGVLSGCSPG